MQATYVHLPFHKLEELAEREPENASLYILMTMACDFVCTAYHLNEEFWIKWVEHVSQRHHFTAMEVTFETFQFPILYLTATDDSIGAMSVAPLIMDLPQPGYDKGIPDGMLLQQFVKACAMKGSNPLAEHTLLKQLYEQGFLFAGLSYAQHLTAEGNAARADQVLQNLADKGCFEAMTRLKTKYQRARNPSAQAVNKLMFNIETLCIEGLASAEFKTPPSKYLPHFASALASFYKTGVGVPQNEQLYQLILACVRLSPTTSEETYAQARIAAAATILPGARLFAAMYNLRPNRDLTKPE